MVAHTLPAKNKKKIEKEILHYCISNFGEKITERAKHRRRARLGGHATRGEHRKFDTSNIVSRFEFSMLSAT